MKKTLILFTVIFTSCKEAPKEEAQLPISDDIIAQESTIDISALDTFSIDSSSYKLATALVNTESTHKALKEENKALKKELTKTKSELNEIKAALVDTIEGAD